MKSAECYYEEMAASCQFSDEEKHVRSTAIVQRRLNSNETFCNNVGRKFDAEEEEEDEVRTTRCARSNKTGRVSQRSM